MMKRPQGKPERLKKSSEHALPLRPSGSAESEKPGRPKKPRRQRKRLPVFSVSELRRRSENGKRQNCDGFGKPKKSTRNDWNKSVFANCDSEGSRKNRNSGAETLSRIAYVLQRR
jgi:hypothetical protein